jgi:hypothetical protein
MPHRARQVHGDIQVVEARPQGGEKETMVLTVRALDFECVL